MLSDEMHPYVNVFDAAMVNGIHGYGQCRLVVLMDGGGRGRVQSQLLEEHTDPHGFFESLCERVVLCLCGRESHSGLLLAEPSDSCPSHHENMTGAGPSPFFFSIAGISIAFEIFDTYGLLKISQGGISDELETGAVSLKEESHVMGSSEIAKNAIQSFDIRDSDSVLELCQCVDSVGNVRTSSIGYPGELHQDASEGSFVLCRRWTRVLILLP